MMVAKRIRHCSVQLSSASQDRGSTSIGYSDGLPHPAAKLFAQTPWFSQDFGQSNRKSGSLLAGCQKNSFWMIWYMKCYLVLLLPVILFGCATTYTPRGQSTLDYSKHFISKGDYDGTFNFIRDLLRSTDPENATYRQQAIELVRSHPPVIEAGKSPINAEDYMASVESDGVEMTKLVYSQRMEALSAVIAEDEMQPLRKILSEIEGQRQIIYASELLLNQLSLNEIAVLQKKGYIRKVRKAEAGVVVDRQMANESTSGNAAGSALGAAVGSAVYVDRATAGPPSNWNYSAKGHLGAQLLGAMIGGAGNAQPTTAYRFRYTLRTLDGSMIYQEDISVSSFGHSNGVCLSTKSLRPFPQEVCEFDLASFRAKYLFP